MDGLPAQLATDQWLDLDEALTRLESIEPEIARLVKLRYFAGLTIKDAAESLGISTRSAVSWWTYARTWLAKELQREQVSPVAKVGSWRTQAYLDTPTAAACHPYFRCHLACTIGCGSTVDRICQASPPDCCS